jgi:hypothetical protein
MKKDNIKKGIKKHDKIICIFFKRDRIFFWFAKEIYIMFIFFWNKKCKIKWDYWFILYMNNSVFKIERFVYSLKELLGYIVKVVDVKMSSVSS